MTGNDFMKGVIEYVTSATPILQIVTPEPDRFEYELKTTLKKIVWQDSSEGEARDVQMAYYRWTLTGGLTKDNVKQKVGDDGPFPPDPVEFLAHVKNLPAHSVVAFINYHHFLNDSNAMAHQVILDLVPHLKSQNKCIIFVNAKMAIPKEVEQDIVILHHPRPDRKYIETILSSTYEKYKQGMKNIKAIDDETRFEAVESALGMTAIEADNAFALSIIKKQTIDPMVVRQLKIAALKKTEIIEYVETDLDFSSVGGLDNLKERFELVLPFFTKEGQAYGLDDPKGFLVTGHPGVGKSEIAKACGKQAKMPILRMNLARVFSKFVGDSEQNIDMACRIAESMAPAILWIDEIEKALAGAGNDGSLDSGVTARVFGHFLTWLNEKKAPVFLFATSNNVENIPPEFLRVGRWDAIFFVDLPVAQERAEIFKIHLHKRKLDVGKYDMDRLIEITEGCTGAEIAQIVKNGKYIAFPTGKQPTMEHFVQARNFFTAESQRYPEKINARRQWARSRALPSSRYQKSHEEEKDEEGGARPASPLEPLGTPLHATAPSLKDFSSEFNDRLKASFGPKKE